VGKFITDLSSVTTVGLDLAKHVFQIHCVDASGRVVVAKAIRRKHLLEFFASLPSCLVGLEASGSAHHWARELITLGHEVRMMPPAYVKPYIRRQKNDASDAAAICEAVTRPTMRTPCEFDGAIDDPPEVVRLRHFEPARHADFGQVSAQTDVISYATG
jgi:transposase